MDIAEKRPPIVELTTIGGFIMAGKKGMRQYPKETVDKVKELRKLGLTHREIGEKLGFEMQQIKKLLERERRKERNQEKGIIPKPKGRQRTHTLTKQQLLELENKKLKRDNDLLRSFLHAVGRM